MLSKKEFIKHSQGYYENDDQDIWVYLDGTYACVPIHEYHEDYPYQISGKLDSIPLEQAMNDETFDALYKSYKENYSDGENARENLHDFLDHLISLEDPDFINDSWIDTNYRWLSGNKYKLIRSFTFEDFEAMVMEIKESYKESYEEDL